MQLVAKQRIPRHVVIMPTSRMASYSNIECVRELARHQAMENVAEEKKWGRYVSKSIRFHWTAA